MGVSKTLLLFLVMMISLFSLILSSHVFICFPVLLNQGRWLGVLINCNRWSVLFGNNPRVGCTRDFSQPSGWSFLAPPPCFLICSRDFSRFVSRSYIQPIMFFSLGPAGQYLRILKYLQRSSNKVISNHVLIVLLTMSLVASSADQQPIRYLLDQQGHRTAAAA